MCFIYWCASCFYLLIPRSQLSLASRVFFHSSQDSPLENQSSLSLSLHIGIKMKFFGWMQSKFNGGQGHKNSGSATSSNHHMKQLDPHHKEEFEDWPRGFLAIGTFGNNDHLPTENEENGTATSSPDLSDFTPEEIGKLQKELTKLLSKKPKQAGDQSTADLPLDRFLNCPSSLEVDRRVDDKEEIDRTIKVILGRCKDICMENTSINSKKAIGKKSVTFLLKKMFVCSSGLPPPLPPANLHHRLPESRMERLLRAILKNKINTQNSSRASSAKKLTQSAKKGKAKATETTDEDANDGSKWVKTDSEYIVLEI